MAPKKKTTPKKAAKEEPEIAKDEEMPEATSPKSPKKSEPASPKKSEPASPKSEPASPAKVVKEFPPEGEEVPTIELPKPATVHDVEWSAKDGGDKRPKTKQVTEMSDDDSTLTLNMHGSVLSTINRDGFQHLLAGGRATTGMKSGRYLYEVRILDVASARDHESQQWKTVRVGFGTAESGYVPGSDDQSFGADNDGNKHTDGSGSKLSGSHRWNVDDVVGVFLNLDASSEHKNTYSIFLNGERQGAPIAIPEKLHGKTLFPLIAVRSSTVAPHFGCNGGRPLKELPFKARMLDDAAAADVVANTVVAPKSGKYDAAFLVGLPNEGTADYLDYEFYPANAEKKYVEVSTRSLLKMCEASGLKGNPTNPASYRIAELDNGAMLKAFRNLAVSKRRNLILMDVSKYLNSKARTAEVANFATSSWFTKRALVTVGAPSKPFVAKVQALELDNEKEILKAKIDGEKARWEADNRQKKAVAEAQYEKTKLLAEAAGEKAPPLTVDPADAEPNWAEKMKVDKALVKDLKFRKGFADMNTENIGRQFIDFTLPKEGAQNPLPDKRWLKEDEEMPEATGGEGFDEIEYAWDKAAGAAKYLAAYKASRKVTEKHFGEKTEYFAEHQEEMNKEKEALRVAQRTYREHKSKRKAKTIAAAQAEKAAEKAAAAAAEKAAAAAAAAEAKKEAEGETPAEGETKVVGEEVKAEEPKAEETKDAEMPEAEKKEEEDDGVDHTVDDDAAPADIKKADVDSIDGKGTPLFKDWRDDDFALLQVRSELHLLASAFKADFTAKDAERKGIHTKLLGAYYQWYFGKSLQTTTYGQTSEEKLLEYCKDTVTVNADGVLAAVHKEENPRSTFIKKVEEERRERQYRLDAGDETARLNFGRGGGAKGGNKGGFKGGKQGFGGGKGIPQQGMPPSSAAGAYGKGGMKRPFQQQQPQTPQGGFPKRQNTGAAPYSNAGKGGKGFGGKGYAR